MSRKSVVALISAIKERANKMIELELKNRDIKGIVPAHGVVLHTLFNNNGRMLQNEIVAATGRVKSTITGIIDTLEANGYVVREQSNTDRRNTFVSLTEKGREVQNVFYEISGALQKKIYKGISVQEQDVLAEILVKILNNIQ